MAFPELSWLPAVADWAISLGGVPSEGGPEAWSALVRLANARIDSLATLRLDRKRHQLFPEAPPGLATIPVRLAVLASSTADHLLPGIRIGALRRGIWLDTYGCGYGQYRRELFDSSSGLHAYAPDTVLFALDARHLLAGFDPADTPSSVDAQLDEVCAGLARNWSMARDAFGCAVVQQTLLPSFPPLFGNNEHRLAGSPARLTERLNQRLREMAEAEGVDLLAIDARVLCDGLHAWHDPALWHRAKQEVHPAAAPMYGDLLGRLLAARQGRASKCLVLDLDNTLWGGVIGDDGLDGIELGQGSALGEAHLDFQNYARALSRRGVILAVCSKNDEANALEPFDRHPDMLLRRADIACFAANWTDKAANIREIAAKLNIGLESLVFVDDNPFERAMVRRELPMVAVPELPEDPALYASCIAEAGYFEGLRLTADDLARNGQYQANLARTAAQTSATDLESYLRSLEMEARWNRFDLSGLSRIVQLINKTNQFNLTTRRMGDEEIAALVADPRALSLQIRLLDRFGDNGIVAVVIGRFETDSTDLLIDTWLMSCRVLGRELERATLNLAAAEAKRLGARRLIGEYRPTQKNGIVRDHYARLGFAAGAELDGGVTRWTMPLETYQERHSFIRTVQAR
ncbi:MAG: HAD family hydrolase [Acetobacteraceae bacterium]|nr:HAD family hydrolase [Acetobacteraceae bacterium]